MNEIWDEEVKAVINTKIAVMLRERKIEEVNVNFFIFFKKPSLLNEDESCEISESRDENIFNWKI